MMDQASPIRVLIVDDSAFARKVLRTSLSASPRIVVVDIARDGLEALEKIADLKPDVVTLDLVMPYLDGIGVLQALRGAGAPRVIVVSTSDAESELGIRALELGAVDIVHKPTALATDRLYELAEELVRKVEGAATAKVLPALTPAARRAEPSLVRSSQANGRAVVIGTSTGGPQALTALLPALPADFPLPIAVVLHIPPGYTSALAHRLNGISGLEVVEAYDGIELRSGVAVIARAGMHLRLQRQGGGVVGRLEIQPITTAHRPSVDVLFESAAAALGAGVLGVVLTGMGDDGLAGAQAICDAGGKVLTEAESSCVIYGMPRCVRDAGLSNAEAPLSEMASAILRRL
jgi:two-component system, chemotaxis family, protein-glutamate methylesterase/glutaminase